MSETAAEPRAEGEERRPQNAFVRRLRTVFTWGFRSLVGLAVLVVLVFVAEGVLRLYDGLPLVERYFEPSEGIPAYRLAPSVEFDYLHDGRPVRVTTDEHGRRIVPGAPTAGGRPLHVVGDSQAFGWGLSDEETVPALLQQHLGDGWRVYNHAVPGYTPFDYAATLGRLPREERVVVLLTETNDLRDAALAELPPLSRCGYLLPPGSLGERLPCSLLSSHLFARLVSLRVRMSGFKQPKPLGFDRHTEPAARVLQVRVESLFAPFVAERGESLLLVVVPWDGAVVPERSALYEPHTSDSRRRVELPGDYGLEAVFRSTAEPEQLFRPIDFHLSAAGARVTADHLATLLGDGGEPEGRRGAPP